MPTRLSLKHGNPAVEASAPIIMVVFAAQGGIADYAAAQAREFASRGLPLLVLSTRLFSSEHRDEDYRCWGCLFEGTSDLLPRRLRQIWMLVALILNHIIAAASITWSRPRLVMFDGYTELMAPIWCWPHLLLDRLLGVVYAVVVHDPDRKRVLGPAWWHRLSIRCGFSMVRVALTHDRDASGLAFLPSRSVCVEVPHGCYFEHHASDCADAEAKVLRRELGVPNDARLLLAFGFIADRKNLHLAIEALAQFPDVHLLIAGRRASERDRSIEFYRDLAARIGVGRRVHFVERFIAYEEAPTYFGAADAVLLTYGSEFVSQSGVLHVAASWEKPVLASSGPGPLVTTVDRYRLGIVVEPDSVTALEAGIARLLNKVSAPLGWVEFRRDASWERNIDLLLNAVDSIQTGRPV